MGDARSVLDCIQRQHSEVIVVANSSRAKLADLLANPQLSDVEWNYAVGRLGSKLRLKRYGSSWAKELLKDTELEGRVELLDASSSWKPSGQSSVLPREFQGINTMQPRLAWQSTKRFG
jgi:hypothetical protein